jgi:MoxR-like ATPase
MSSVAASSETNRLSDDDVAAIDRLRENFASLRAELAKVIVGQDKVIEQLAICLFARRHALLIGQDAACQQAG